MYQNIPINASRVCALIVGPDVLERAWTLVFPSSCNYKSLNREPGETCTGLKAGILFWGVIEMGLYVWGDV
jgi:hypothetical protein